MVSAIDPSNPEDGVPAEKAALRANFAVAKAEIEHGGFAEGLTPTRYTPASSRVADHLAAIDLTLQSIGGDAAGLTGWTDVRSDFGAMGDGIVDDTAALQNALNSGASVVFMPAGTYRITASLVVVPGTQLVGAGPGQTTIDATELPSQLDPAAIVCEGAVVTLPSLAAAISEGDKSITFELSIEAEVEENDAIGIADDRGYSFMGYSEATRDGCWINVLARNGSTVVCASGVPRSLPSTRLPGGTLADLVAVRIDRRGVALRDFTVNCRGLGSWPDGTTQMGTGVTLRWLADAVVERVHVRGAPTNGLGLDRCVRARVSDCIATGLSTGWSSGLGQYGAAFGGCAYSVARNTYFAGGRHAFDFGAGGGGQPVRQIPCHDNWLIGCTLESPAENDFVLPDSVVTWAASWHESTFRCNVINSTIALGCAFRGFGHTIANNTIIMPKQDANLRTISGDHLGPRAGITIQGNYIRTYTSKDVIGLDFDLLDSVEDPGVVMISNNIIDDRSSGGDPVIKFTSGPPASRAYVKIHDNVVMTSQARDFVSISSNDGDYVSVSILDNQLSVGMELGSIANVEDWTARNMIGGHLEFGNLPTSNPGGSGRLWNDMGALRVT